MAEHLDRYVKRLKGRLAELKRRQADQNKQRELALQIKVLEDQLGFLVAPLTQDDDIAH